MQLTYSTNVLSFMGVDPGTSQLGVAKIDFDPYTGVIVHTSAVTLSAERNLDYDTEEVFDSDLRRYARLRWYEHTLTQEFQFHQPVRLAVESNYISRATPSAYGPLVESVLTIRQAAYNYNPNMTVVLIDPMSAKNAVQAKTRGLSKEDNKLAVWRAIGSMSDILCLPHDIYAQLSQHASDAIAIAYCAFLRYRDSFRTTAFKS